MYAGGSVGSNPRGPPPPGFFQGVYGGPRMQFQPCNPPPIQNYSFLKLKDEHLDKSDLNSPASRTKTEPLNDEILEGCANLFDETGKRVQVILRDGRILVGDLASVDHFSNVMLRDAVERIVVDKQYGDIRRGVFIVRGDNIALVGEVDGEREAAMERILEQVPTSEILLAQKCEQDIEKAKKKKYFEALKNRGVAFPKQLEDEC